MFTERPLKARQSSKILLCTAFLASRYFVHSFRILHALCAPPSSSAGLGTSTLAQPRQQPDTQYHQRHDSRDPEPPLPQHLSCSRRKLHTACRCVSSQRRCCFSLAWQDPPALPATLLAQLMLFNHNTGAEGAVEPCINSVRASAAELSAVVLKGRTHSPPNLNRDGPVSMALVLWPWEGLACRVSGCFHVCSFSLYLVNTRCAGQQAEQTHISVLGPNRHLGCHTMQTSVCTEAALMMRGSPKPNW